MLLSIIISKGQAVDNYYNNFNKKLSDSKDLKEIITVHLK